MASVPNLDDLQPGSEADFERLYRATYDRVFAVCLAILGDPGAAQDCCHDAYVRAYRAWPNWRPEAPAGAWLHRIAVNRARSYRRRRMLREIPRVLDFLPSRNPGPDSAIDFSGALARLPVDEASAFVMRIYHGYSTSEIATALGISERTARLRIQNARQRLVAILGADWGNSD